MSIRKRGKAWQIDYRDPSGKRIRRSFRKRKEAEAELGKRVSLIAEGRYLDVKKETKVTFDELVKRYIENYRHQRSFDISKRYFIKALLDQFSGRMLSTISYYDCEKFLTDRKNTLTKAGTMRTASTLNKELGTFRHMLRKAVEWDLLERSPFDKGKSLHLKENTGRLRYLSIEEIKALLKECPRYLRDIVEVVLLTGMRKGEALSLRWAQIAGGFIYIEKSKTDEARQIPVTNDLDAVFRRIRQGQWKRGLKVEYVFGDDQGKSFQDVRRSFGSACKRAGIIDFRFHDLRHTFASHFVMRGGSLKALQKILGHKDIHMTMRYSHLSREFVKEEIQIMNNLWRGQKTYPQNVTKM